MNRQEEEALMVRAENKAITEAEAEELLQLDLPIISLMLVMNPRVPVRLVKLAVERAGLNEANWRFPFSFSDVFHEALKREDLPDQLVLDMWEMVDEFCQPKEGKSYQFNRGFWGMAVQGFLTRKLLPSELFYRWDQSDFDAQPLIRTVLYRPEIPVEILVKYSHARVRPESQLITVVGMNQRLPEERLLEMAGSPLVAERKAVAGNPRLPIDVIERMTRDSNGEVRGLAGGNLGASYEAQQRGILAPNRLDLIMSNPKRDPRIIWEMASLPMGILPFYFYDQNHFPNSQSYAEYMASFLRANPKEGDARALDWMDKRAGWRLEIGGSKVIWRTPGVTLEWDSDEGDLGRGVEAAYIDWEVKTVGWWEPEWEQGGRDHWFLVTDRGEADNFRGEVVAGWAALPEGFDGVLVALEGSNRGSGGKTKLRYLTRAEVEISEDSVRIRNQVVSLKSGEAPELPSLKKSYGRKVGPYSARGLLLNEDKTLDVLWVNPAGEPVGWEPVQNWEEALEIEASGGTRPRASQLAHSRWENLEKLIRAVYGRGL